MDRHRRRLTDFVTWFVVFFAVGLLVAYLNRDHVEQQFNFNYYVAMADYYRGLAPLERLTYPTWGYPFVLLLIRRYDLVALPQVLVATVAMTALFLRLRREVPDHRRGLAILFALAIPWYLVHSVKWPLSFAASFSMLGILVLERALRNRSTATGMGAGLLFGLALYFRSEFLFLPLFIAVMGLLARVTGRTPGVPIAPLASCAIVAWIALVPWAIHYRQQTGHYSLTASQRGIVAFISLGQLPRNPWGAVYEDEYAYAYLKQVAPHLAVNSDPADRILIDEFKRRVKAEPAAFAAKMVWNGAISLVSGFYSGEIPLSPAQWDRFRQMKKRPWAAVVPALAGSGDLTADGRTRATLLYWFAAKGLGVGLVLLGVGGVIYALWRGTVSPLLLLLALPIIYQWLLFIGLSTEPRYKNGLYLCMVPFICIAWQALTEVASSYYFARTGSAVICEGG